VVCQLFAMVALNYRLRNIFKSQFAGGATSPGCKPSKLAHTRIWVLFCFNETAVTLVTDAGCESRISVLLFVFFSFDCI